MAVWIDMRMHGYIASNKHYLDIREVKYKRTPGTLIIHTDGESKGYLCGNLNCNWYFSPSYNVPVAPVKLIIHLRKKERETLSNHINEFGKKCSHYCSFFMHDFKMKIKSRAYYEHKSVFYLINLHVRFHRTCGSLSD